MKTLLFICLGAFSFTMYSNFSDSSASERSLEKRKYKNHLTWDDFNEVTYKDVYLKELDSWFWQPEFSEKLMSVDNDTIHIAGFLQNGGTEEKPAYILCHHKKMHFGCCSSTGPDDMIDLGPNFDRKELDLADSILIKGKLILNVEDVYRLNYLMEGTTVVEAYGAGS